MLNLRCSPLCTRDSSEPITRCKLYVVYAEPLSSRSAPHPSALNHSSRIPTPPLCRCLVLYVIRRPTNHKEQLPLAGAAGESLPATDGQSRQGIDLLRRYLP